MINSPLFPSPDALRAFGATAIPTLLPGGRQTAYRVGGIVLKPVDGDAPENEAEIAWSAETLNNIPQLGFRVPRYIAPKSGEWRVDGWYAQEWLEGAHSNSQDRWQKLIEVCKLFHGALLGVSRPDFLDRRTDPWAIADRVAWGELPLTSYPELKDPLDKLSSVLRPVNHPSQVIHGDITGNVLFAENLAPAIIDFSPYWRPAEFAQAIIIVDALVWEGADVSILNYVSDVKEIDQMLVRAEIRRLMGIDGHHRQSGKDTLAEVDAHLKTVNLIYQRAATS
jgi:uncharacterized protein (TIGR02569 family)